jgi:putative transcriptional regulator
MTVYMTKEFSRFARKAKLIDATLVQAANDVAAGRYDADLGAGVFKQRIAREGGGKSGGFRVIILWFLQGADSKSGDCRRVGRGEEPMTVSRKTEAGILRSVHKTASGLHKSGLVDKATMREFDALCLTPVTPLTPREIRALREREQVSQPVFAQYLNVRKDAVSKWERGEKRPDGPSLKLLNLVKAKGLRAIA